MTALPLYSKPDTLKHTIQFLHHLIIPKPQHGEPTFTQQGISPHISSTIRMLPNCVTMRLADVAGRGLKN